MNNIYPAQPADAPALSTLVNLAYRGESGKQGWTTESDLIDGTRTDAELIEQIIRKPGSLILKYVEENEIIGCVELRKEGEGFYLGMLTVKPNIQGKGIGKALLSASEEEGRKQGCTKMFMRVLAPRLELIAWYLRHGYT
ncbi:MAG TPA: GNAT family N-acetyltransferase, partial [Cyclobacteriaceae bacterium]|nr:GNAT family N-acetyltransferase [Cyclobacteriaceae bacterium]